MGTVEQTSLLAERARSECARSMRAVEANPTIPVGDCPKSFSGGEGKVRREEKGAVTGSRCSRKGRSQTTLVGRAQPRPITAALQ